MECFRPTYRKARAGFRTAARRAGALLFRYGRRDVRGIEGEALSVDVAVLGSPGADRIGLVISGIHGGEAFAGSAIQTAWLSGNGHEPVPDGVRLVLIHGANPWGFSHMARATEGNVDLNRNFRTSWPGPDNAAYDELRPFLHAARLDAAEDLRAWRAYCAHLDQRGWDLEGRAISGQGQCADGVYYCGTGPDWAQLTFLRILGDHLNGGSRIGFIDFHTGIGDYAEVVHLVFAPEGSEERSQAMAWWSLAGDGASGFRAGTLPPYEGLAANAIARHLPAAKVAGSVIEFGTSDAFGVFRADRLDRWLRFEGRRDVDHAALRAACRDACNPRDLGWRRLVLREGCDRIDRMLAGLAFWT